MSVRKARSGALLWLLLAALAAAAGCAATRAALSSREYKIRLDPGRFAEPTPALQGLWEEVRGAAEGAGYRVSVGYQPWEPRQRLVAYLDSPDHALRAHGWILRERVPLSGGRPQEKLDYALKFRSPDRSEAEAAALDSPSLRCRLQVQEDVVASGDGLRSVFSKRCKVKRSAVEPSTVASWAAIFPSLGSLGLSPATELAPVGGKQVLEQVYGPGRIDLGDCVAEPSLTLWFEGERVQVAELSFTVPLREVCGGEALFTLLSEHVSSWAAADGQTKTETFYDAPSSEPGATWSTYDD